MTWFCSMPAPALKQGLKLTLALAGASLAAAAQAALLQVAGPSVSTAFDSQLSSAALIYDFNFYSATEGRLVVMASATSLSGPGVPTGSSAPSQFYLGATDTLRDVVIQMRINNSTGALVSGSVSVPADNLASGAADSWSYGGTITNFGVAENSGSTVNTFDARWFADGYNFSDVVANPALSVPGAPQVCSTGAGLCGYGYLRFSTAAVPFLGGVGTGVNFATDWVRGAGLSSPNPALGTYDDGIATAAFAAQAVSADVFLTPVPTPGSFALMAAGMLALLPLMRRRLARD